MIIENTSIYVGGGIYIRWESNYSGGFTNPILINNTIIFNTAQYGGGLSLYTEEAGKS